MRNMGEAEVRCYVARGMKMMFQTEKDIKRYLKLYKTKSIKK